jgi:hypothetical protein
MNEQISNASLRTVIRAVRAKNLNQLGGFAGVTLSNLKSGTSQ